MPQNKTVRSIYAPHYVKEFSCIGSACEDTCCAGWRVVIDQKTYRKYRNTDEPNVKTLLNANLKRIRDNPTEQNYAYIQMRSDDTCPMLTAERLCGVQKHLGEAALSTTCSVYPRRYNAVLGTVEATLTMSCPEAARLALLNPAPMGLVEIPVTKTTTFHVDAQVELGDGTKVEHYYANLRIFAIEVLQNRDYSISDRLILLGLAMRKVQECVNSARLSDIPTALNSYAETVKSGVLKESLNGISNNRALQIKLMKAVIDKTSELNISNRRYNECYEEFLSGLGVQPGVTDEEIIRNYNLANGDYFQPFMKNHEYIFEHYLISSALQNTFPLTGGLSVFESYVSLMLPFAWIKLMSVGMAGHEKKEFNQDSVLKLIQSYSKLVEHSPVFKNGLISFLKQDGHDSMPYLSILLHN